MGIAGMATENEVNTLVELLKAAPGRVIAALFAVIGLTWAITHWVEGSSVAYWKDRAGLVSQLSSDDIKNILEERWPPLTDEEAASLETKLRTFPKPNGILLRCGGSDCYALADSLKAVIKKVDWNFSEDSVMYPGLFGIKLVQPDPTDRTLANSITQATKGRLAPTIEASSTTWTFVAIGRRPKK